MSNTKITPKARTVKKTSVKAAVRKPPKEENILQPSFKKHCSYCGKPSTQAKRLIAGPPPLFPFICDECIEVCVKILMEDCPQDWRSRIISILAMPAEKNKTPPEKNKSKTKTTTKRKT